MNMQSKLHTIQFSYHPMMARIYTQSPSSACRTWKLWIAWNSRKRLNS